MGAFCSAGNDVPSLWNSVREGRSPAKWVYNQSTHKLRRLAGCQILELPACLGQFHRIERMDRVVQIALGALNEAWINAELDRRQPEAQRIGLTCGISRSPVNRILDSSEIMRRKRRIPPSTAANSTIGSLTGALAQYFNLKGPSFTLSSTCTSSAAAITVGALQIIGGGIDIAIAGGAETPLHPLLFEQLSSAGILGHAENPEASCRPFDATRDGTILGEGAGFLILESKRSMESRQVKPLARLSGWSLGVDQAGRTGVNEEGEGLFQSIEESLRMAQISVRDIDYINAHGTATVINDSAEAKAIQRATQSDRPSIPCSSTKPVTGHCLGATSALEAIISVLALRHQCLPPTINYRNPDPSIPLDVISEGAREKEAQYVMSNSLGFWGYCASLIFSKT